MWHMVIIYSNVYVDISKLWIRLIFFAHFSKSEGKIILKGVNKRLQPLIVLCKILMSYFFRVEYLRAYNAPTFFWVYESFYSSLPRITKPFSKVIVWRKLSQHFLTDVRHPTNTSGLQSAANYWSFSDNLTLLGVAFILLATY